MLQSTFLCTSLIWVFEESFFFSTFSKVLIIALKEKIINPNIVIKIINSSKSS